MNAENMCLAKKTNDGAEMPLPNFILQQHFRKHKSKKPNSWPDASRIKLRQWPPGKSSPGQTSAAITRGLNAGFGDHGPPGT
jgi:hypothetical protein